MKCVGSWKCLCRFILLVFVFSPLSILLLNEFVTHGECNIKETLYFSHRGYTLDHQENTILAFLDAMNRGYGVEMDVMCSADHTPFLFHDFNTLRLTGMNKEFKKLTDIEIGKLDIKKTIDNLTYNNTAKIPSLNETLSELCKKSDTVAIDLDLKVDSDEEFKIINEVIKSSPCKGEIAVATFSPLKISSLEMFSPMHLIFFLHPGSWPLAPLMDYTYYKTMIWSLLDDDNNVFSAPKDVYDKFSGMMTYKERGYCLGVYGLDENDLKALPKDVYSSVVFDVPGQNPYHDVYKQMIWPYVLLTIIYIFIWIILIADVFISCQSSKYYEKFKASKIFPEETDV